MRWVGGFWLVGILMTVVLGGCSGIRQPQLMTTPAIASARLSRSVSILSPTKKIVKPQSERELTGERSLVIISRDLEDIETGVASWYGPGFHGRQTANGEIYDQYALTAAHPHLPLGTRVKVTNLDTGKSVDVRINDRGPYKYGRVIDLSYEAARRVGVWAPGTAPVRVTVLNSDGTLPKERVLMVSAYAILVASSTNIGKCVTILRELSRKYPNAYLMQLSSGSLSYYQVRIGPFQSRREAQVHARQMVRLGTLALVVAEDDQRAAR